MFKDGKLFIFEPQKIIIKNTILFKDIKSLLFYFFQTHRRTIQHLSYHTLELAKALVLKPHQIVSQEISSHFVSILTFSCQV